MQTNASHSPVRITVRAAQGSLVRAAVGGAAALLLTLPMLGCGGGFLNHGGGSAANVVSRAKVGTASITVKWPPRTATKLIPVSSESIVVSMIYVPGSNPDVKTSIAPQTVTLHRPVADPTTTSPTQPPPPLVSTATFSNLALGKWTVTATAFPNSDGTGSKQATASTIITIVAGPNTVPPITMGTQIVSATVTPITGANMRASDTRQFTATFFDATGAMVLVASPINPAATSLVWSLTDAAGNATSLATLDQNGLLTIGASTTVAANTNLIIHAKDTESGLSATATATIAPVGLALSAWPKFHGDAQNTGRAASTAPNAVGTGTWAFTTGREVEFSSAAVSADGTTVYIGCNDNNLYALTTSGAKKWTFPTGGQIEGSPLIGRDGTIYFGSYDGIFYAIQDTPDANAGTQYTIAWTFTAGGPIHTSPALDNQDFVYFGTTSFTAGSPGTFFKLDGFTGAQKWSFSGTGDGIQTAPALNTAQSIVYFGSLDDNVYALRTTDGSSAWGAPAVTGAPLYASSPAVGTVNGTETVFIGSLDGKVYALNANSGSSIWPGGPVDLASGAIYTTPALLKTAGNTTDLFVATFDNTTGTSQNIVFRINAATGSTSAWAAPQAFSQGFTSSPAISGDGSLVYIGCYDGNVYALKVADGSTSWTFTPTPPATGTLTFDSSPSVGPDGKIYIGGVSGASGGQVYAIK